MAKENNLDIFPFRTIRKIITIIPDIYRGSVIITILLVVSLAILDVFSLASIIPLILVLLDSSLLQSNEYLSYIYETIGFSDSVDFIVATVLFLLAVFILKNAFNLFVINFQSRLVYNVATHLSEREFKRFYRQEYDQFINDHSSLSMRNIVQIPTEFSIYVLLAGISLLSELLVFTFILCTIGLYSLNLLLLLLIFLGLPLTIIFYFQKHKVQDIGRLTEKLKPAVLKDLSEGIHSYVEAKLYNKEKYFVENYISQQKKLNKNFARFFTASFLPARIIEVVAVSSIVILVLYSLYVSQSTEHIILLLTLFSAAAYRIMPALSKLSVAFLNIKSYRFTIDVLYDAHRAEPEYISPESSIRIKEKISLRDISFSFDALSEFRIDDVNMEIRMGEIIGIWGKSGAGKTTLINILLRLFKEQSGKLLIDGQELSDSDTAAWRDLMGYVRQDPFLLDDTIKKNIAFAEFSEEVNEKQLQKAIDQAGLRELVSGLPAGVATEIGERGYRLSGGQKQRLAIARALYRNSQILIFDEPTNEIDIQTEQEILKVIKRLSAQDRIIILIAHNPSTLSVCHRIFEIKDGRISADMTPDEIQARLNKSA